MLLQISPRFLNYVIIPVRLAFAGNTAATNAERLSMVIDQFAPGSAALSILESLLLALNDRKILSEGEIVGILTDAATAHENTTEPGSSHDHHKAVVALINQILDGGNSVRRKHIASSNPT